MPPAQSPAPSPTPDAAPKAYQPTAVEPRITARWESSRVFHADPQRVLRGEAKPYCILIPPPNVTGALHLGHALNNTLQDILTRAHRMKGFETLWMPGTDHAGIATQAVVERRLLKEENKRRKDFTREQFVEKVQSWKDEYEARITAQLKAMGASCDFERQRFTMDPICARAVREAFFRLFADGLIYRGKRLVNWDPELQTAVADDECYDEEIDSFFYYLRYPLVHPDTRQPVTWSELARRGYPGADTHPPDQQAWITVATTRPETYLGDTAVAVNPKDPRAKALHGLMAQLPLVRRVIPILEDDYVVLPAHLWPKPDEAKNDPKAQFATGFLKVTPAHDPNDYDLGMRHRAAIEAAGIPVLINVMAPDASISGQHGWSDPQELEAAHLFLGLSREKARKKVIDEFKARTVGGVGGLDTAPSLLEGTRPYRHSVKHSDRTKKIIEPYLSDQWFVRVTDDRLAGAANRALVPDQRTAAPSAPSSGGTGVSPVRPFNIHRRNLPHWQRGGATYFITFRAQGQLSEAERQIALDAASHWHGQRMELHAAVIMPDHAHLLLSPFALGDGQWHTLPELLHSIKSFSAKEIAKRRGRPGPVWQDESYDRLIRDPDEFGEKITYIAENPVRKGLAPRWSAYPFTHISDHAQQGRLEFAEQVRGTSDQGRTGETPVPPEPPTPRAPTDGTMRFFPARYAKTFEQWHDNIRDWCISRQLWWGHRIPVWSRTFDSPREFFGHPGTEEDAFSDTLTGLDDFSDDAPIAYSITSPELPGVDLRQPKAMPDLDDAVPITVHVCVHASGVHKTYAGELDIERWLEAHGFTRDPDVLDTWFSSALWPLSTMGWPDPDQSPETKDLLPAFNPTTVLSTAREIITLWVSRMVMMNRYFLPDSWSQAADGDRTLLPVWHKRARIDASTWEVELAPLVRPGGESGPAFGDMMMDCVDGMKVEFVRLSDRLRADPSMMVPVVPDLEGEYDITVRPRTEELARLWRLDEAGFRRVPHGQGSGPPPFRDVFIHAVVQDGEGRKMSKSLGNGVDPLDIIESHGADAMRFALCHMTTQTQDVRLPVVKDPKSGKNTSPKFDAGRNFCNKLWNTARFALDKLPRVSAEGTAVGAMAPITKDQLTLPDRWMLSRLASAVRQIDTLLANYEFADYAETMYRLLWWDLCDWYLEAVKPTIAQSPAQQAVLAAALRTITRLLHPIAPFITEAVHEQLETVATAPVHGVTLTPPRTAGLLATAGWPILDIALVDAEAEPAFEKLREVVTAVRNVRSEHQVPPKRKVTLHVSPQAAKTLSVAPGLVETLAGLDRVEVLATPAPPKNAGATVAFRALAEEMHLTNLADALDSGAERDRLTKHLETLRKSESALAGRLSNPGYADKAPPRLVEESRAQLARIREDITATESKLAAL